MKMSSQKKEKTFGFKATDEDYLYLEELFKESGFPSKDEWVKSLVKQNGLESTKEANHEFKQPLTELQVHTSRIYELVVNMVNQAVYLRNDAVKQVTEKLDQREAIIGEYQEKAKAAIEELKVTKESLKDTEQENAELSKQVESYTATFENNQSLISEYKEKIDTLSGLVTRYQEYQQENERLKEQFAHERSQLQSQVKEVTKQNDDQQEDIKELHRQNETLKNNYKVELERIGEKMENMKSNHAAELEKKDYEKEKALLETEREFQQRLLQVNDEHNAKIQSLYNEIDRLRKEYDQKIEKLQQANDEK